MKRLVILAAALGGLMAAAPASAQYYGGYGYGPGPGYEEDYRPRRRRDFDDDYYDRRRDYDRRRGGYDGPRGGRGAGRVCVTSRGNCPAFPSPPGSSCACSIPAFGEKRGIVQ